MNMSLLETETITVKRRPDGFHMRGHYRRGRIESFSIKANIQPITGKDLLQVPEGDRTKQHKAVFTKFELKLNDIIIRKGIKYEVQNVEDWLDFCIVYYRGRAVKLDKQDEEI